MFKVLKISVFILAWILSNAAIAEQTKALTGNNLVVLENITLIDGTGAAPKKNAVVIFQDSRIKEIGIVGDFSYPASAQIHQLDNHFIIPGLIDVHTHIQSPFHKEELKMLLAYGITSIRIPGGTDVGVKVKKWLKVAKL